MCIMIGEEALREFHGYLKKQEFSAATIGKYMRDVRLLSDYAAGCIREKEQLIGFKQYLLERGFAHTSVNSMLAAVNCFLRFSGRKDWSLRFLRLQTATLIDQQKEMTRREYERLVRTAVRRGDERLALLLQTLCALGIRVSELQSITRESLEQRQATIRLKGKTRRILMPENVTARLLCYCQKHHIQSGPVFVTRGGRPIDRSNIWKMMKRLAKEAGVSDKKIFPHNLRHLFAQTYYEKFRDIVRLADVLGHSSVNTTRIYMDTDNREQRRRMNALSLML